jgi:hypothetical protein
LLVLVALGVLLMVTLVQLEIGLCFTLLLLKVAVLADLMVQQIFHKEVLAVVVLVVLLNLAVKEL